MSPWYQSFLATCLRVSGVVMDPAASPSRLIRSPGRVRTAGHRSQAARRPGRWPSGRSCRRHRRGRSRCCRSWPARADDVLRALAPEPTTERQRQGVQAARNGQRARAVDLLVALDDTFLEGASGGERLEDRATRGRRSRSRLEKRVSGIVEQRLQLLLGDPTRG